MTILRKKLAKYAAHYVSSPSGTTISLDINIKEAVVLLGSAGGFNPTKQTIQGDKILWRAYNDLQIITVTISSSKQRELLLSTLKFSRHKMLSQVCKDDSARLVYKQDFTIVRQRP